MRLVHAHAAYDIIFIVKERDLVRLLEHLHSRVAKNEGHPFGPTLVARVRSGVTA
jgi:hypothetical protein